MWAKKSLASDPKTSTPSTNTPGPSTSLSWAEEIEDDLSDSDHLFDNITEEDMMETTSEPSKPKETTTSSSTTFTSLLDLSLTSASNDGQTEMAKIKTELITTISGTMQTYASLQELCKSMKRNIEENKRPHPSLFSRGSFRPRLVGHRTRVEEIIQKIRSIMSHSEQAIGVGLVNLLEAEIHKNAAHIKTLQQDLNTKLNRHGDKTMLEDTKKELLALKKRWLEPKRGPLNFFKRK